MNVRKNIGYPLVSQGMGRVEVRRRVEDVARILGIAAILDRPVGGLSSGDRQRVALGRAIVRQPKVPDGRAAGALDAEFREHMAEELRALHDRMGETHGLRDPRPARGDATGDKIVVMNHGVVEQWGMPQEIHDRPGLDVVADSSGCRR